MTPVPGPTRGGFPWRWFWAGFLLCIAAGLVLALFAGIRGTAQWADRQLEPSAQTPTVWSEVIQLTLHGGETLHLDPARLPLVQARARAWIADREVEARLRLHRELAQAREDLLALTLEQVPRFADWHYSLQGEYARLLHAALGDLPHFMAERMLEHVFEPAGVSASLEAWVADLDRGLERELRDGALEANRLLARMVREQAVEPTDTLELRVVERRTLGADLSARLEPRLGLAPEDLARQGVAASTGALAGALAMKKLGLATAGKLGLKAAGGALAGSGGGAVTGAALCGASVVAAPLAAGCALVGGIVAGIGTWMLVDKGVLETEEYLRRAAFETELREAIRLEFERLGDSLESHYLDALATGFGQLQRGLDELLRPTGQVPEKTFVPSRAIQGQD